MNEEIFKNEVEKLGITVTQEQMRQLEIIYNVLIDTNKTMNLTRITAKDDVYLKHFYDSLTLIKIFDLSKVTTLCDVGTGAGFPGLILKVFYPNLKVTLIDALQKRVNYLNNLIDKLNLTDIKAYHIRAEDLIKKNQTFDVVTSRAVASLPKLLSFTMPLVNKNGSFLAMKGNAKEEINLSKDILTKNNWKIKKNITFDLPNNQGFRTLLEIKKNKD